MKLLIQPAAERGVSALVSDVTPVAQLSGFLWVPYFRACAVCRIETTWLDSSFECPVHPGKCSEQMWDDFKWSQTWEWLHSPAWGAMLDEWRTEP